MTAQQTNTNAPCVRDATRDNDDDGAGGRGLRNAVIVFAVVEALFLVPFLLYMLFFR